MLIRPKFITNSSTSSYLVYGVSVQNNELRKVLRVLLSGKDIFQFVTENKEKSKWMFGDFDLLEYKSSDQLLEDIIEYMIDQEPYEWIEKLTSGKLLLEWDYESGYDNYIGINKSFATSVEGDNVVMTRVTVEDYGYLKELCEKADLKDKGIGFTHWARYS
jgi:hypothetical protein